MTTLRYTLSALFVLLTLIEIALSQDDEIAKFNTLRTPTSPAFTILGVAPASVERPNTPQDLAVSLLNKTENFSTLPSDYALEFAPFWLFSHPSLTWKQDAKRDVLESITRTSTVSIASAEIGTDAFPVTGFSVGFRTSLWSGTSTARAETAYDSAIKVLSSGPTTIIAMKKFSIDKWLSTELGKVVNQSREKIDSLIKLHKERTEVLLDTIMRSEEYRKAREDADKTLAGLYISEREGFSLELAGAAAWKVPGKILDSMSLNTWGIWLTPSYVMDDFSFVGVARLLQDGEDSGNRNIDFGARIIYTIDRFALSAEAVFRSQKIGEQTESQTRVAGVLEYQVMPDIWLQGTFGKDYQPSAEGSLLAQLGLSFNFSGKRFQLPTKTE